jgi:hypothetical protein
MSVVNDQTLVVAYPQLLPGYAVRELEESAADVVLLGPVATRTGYLGISAGGEVGFTDRNPECTLPAAAESGSVHLGGTTLNTNPNTTGSAGTTIECFPADDLAGPTLVQATTSNGATHTIVGSAEFMTNEWLDDAGNASLAMNVLGENPSVVWWLPSPVFTGTQPLTSLLPDEVWPVLGAVVLLVLLVAVWQGRRLGTVVVEPLPVAVRASETTEGRARIYQRHRTRDQAALHLRTLTASDLGRRLGLPAGAEPPAVVAAVADATGQSSAAVENVLYGPPPGRDEDLVALGRQLAAIDLEVRRS